MCRYKREQKQKKPQTNKTKRKKEKRSKPLIAVLEELVKISGIIFERFCLDTNYWLLNIKQNTKQKQQQKTQEQHKVLKDFPPNPPHFSDGFFTCSLPVPMFKDMFCTHSSRLLRLCLLLNAICF